MVVGFGKEKAGKGEWFTDLNFWILERVLGGKENPGRGKRVSLPI